jgi:hypothetical protein
LDELCARLNVTGKELPHAFAAQRSRNFDWDGRYERAED